MYPYWWGQLCALMALEIEAEQAKKDGKLKRMDGKDLTQKEIDANNSSAAFSSHNMKIAQAKAILGKS